MISFPITSKNNNRNKKKVGKWNRSAVCCKIGPESTLLLTPNYCRPL